MCNSSKDLSDDDTNKMVDYFAYIQNDYNKEVDIYNNMKKDTNIIADKNFKE
jgi:hypothetical protein